MRVSHEDLLRDGEEVVEEGGAGADEEDVRCRCLLIYAVGHGADQTEGVRNDQVLSENSVRLPEVEHLLGHQREGDRDEARDEDVA